MQAKNTSLPSLVLGLSVTFILATGAWRGYNLALNKLNEQRQTIQEFRQWKQEYTTLMPVRDRWDNSFPKTGTIKDLFSLYELLPEGTTTNPDRLVIEKIERVKVNGKDVGLNKICMTSMGGNGVIFEGKSPSSLLKTVKLLQEKPYIRLESIRLANDKEKLTLSVSGLCFHLKD